MVAMPPMVAIPMVVAAGMVQSTPVADVDTEHAALFICKPDLFTV